MSDQQTPEEPFQQHFGRACEVSASAPGRVNLIGEHTDYNLGFVLPTTIPQHTTVDLARRGDRQISAYAEQMQQGGEYQLGQERRTQGWLDYLAGVTQELTRAGHTLSGFDAYIRSDVPLGSGLSSSAALLVALLRGLRQLFGLDLDDVQVAQLAQRAENGLVGAQVGIMDQMACSLASPGEALFLDCRDLSFSRLPLPPEAELVVLHSGVEHSHAGGDYNARRAECEGACELLGVESLRELDWHSETDKARVNALPEPLNRRARHVLSENARVLAVVEQLSDAPDATETRLREIGALFYASHDSMRDDYAVSVPQIDLIVRLAAELPDLIYGARMTGGGFGGSVVMLAVQGRGREAGERIAAEYARQSGETPRLLMP